MKKLQLPLTTVVVGTFALPIGLALFDSIDHIKSVTVSTVCLEGGHLRDPLGICSAEHGYETMVFLAGCKLFGVFTAKYSTESDARKGHRSVIRKLLHRTLPLAIDLLYYANWVEKTGSANAPQPGPSMSAEKSGNAKGPSAN